MFMKYFSHLTILDIMGGERGTGEGGRGGGGLTSSSLAKRVGIKYFFLEREALA